jgi:sec-independent protein translocase protein TatA
MEIVLIVGLVLLLFGGTKLPQLGKSLGEGIRNFKKGFTGEDEQKTANAPPPAQPPSNDGKLSASTGGAETVDAAKTKQA